MNQPSMRHGAIAAAFATALGLVSAADDAHAQYYAQTQVTAQPVQYNYNAAVVVRTGWFFRGALGAGFGLNSVSGDSAFTVTGPAILADVAFGWTLADNFALHFDVAAATVLSPSLSTSATSSGGTSTFTARLDSTNVTQSMAGVGATWYLPEFLGYFSANAGLALVQAEVYSGSATTRYGESRLGFGLNLIGGKEWLLTNRWTFGVGAQVLYSVVPDQDNHLWNNLAGGLVLSFTDSQS